VDTYILTGLFTVFRPRDPQDAQPRGSVDNVFLSALFALATHIRKADVATHQKVAGMLPASEQRLLLDGCRDESSRDLALEQLLEVMEPYLELLPEPHRLFFRPSSVQILHTADYVVLSRHQEGYWYPHAPI